MPAPLTITIDDRAGSQYYIDRNGDRIDLADFFRKHRTQPEVKIRRLPAADFAFSGNGSKGPSLIGVERKTTKDMLSSMRSGRFSGEQLPKLLDHYEYVYLVVEGRHRTNWTTGMLEERVGRQWRNVMVGTQSFVGLELESFLNDLAIKAPVKIKETHDFPGTVEYTLALAYTFSKPWDRHNAHLAIHVPEPYVTVEKASSLRRVAYSLQGIGWVLSGKIDQHPLFKRPGDFFLAGHPELLAQVEEKRFRNELCKVEGIGNVLSGKVWKELYGGGDR